MAPSHPAQPFSATNAHLRVEGLSFSHGARRVLTDLTFSISSGERVGLIGENGSGKSTLLSLIGGSLHPEAGTVWTNVPGGKEARIGLQQQELPFPHQTTVQMTLEDAVEPARTAAQEVERLGAALSDSPSDGDILDSYSSALAEAERLHAWDLDHRIDEMVSGLALDSIGRSRPIGTLSGGQRARLYLAWLLLSEPTFLLLDEPTNHLDDDATDYLTGVLRSWSGPVLMASHDRSFLEETATSLLDLDPAPTPLAVSRGLLQDGEGTGIGITRFTGTYGSYVDAQGAALARWEKTYGDEQAQLKQLRSAAKASHTVGHAHWKPRTESRIAKKFYGDRNARVVSRRVGEAQARLERLEKEQIRRPPARLEFRGLHAGSSSAPQPPTSALVASEVSVEGRLAPTSFALAPGEKLLVTGGNGTGKSTLLGVVAGTVRPTSGAVSLGSSAVVGMLAQDSQIPADLQVLPAHEAYAAMVGWERAKEVPLSAFGLLEGRDQNRRVTELSVGQRRRLELAAVLAVPPQILLLDEPTNHLSLRLVTALEEALASYPGSVVVASHDRTLRSKWEGEHLHLGPEDRRSRRQG